MSFLQCRRSTALLWDSRLPSPPTFTASTLVSCNFRFNRHCTGVYPQHPTTVSKDMLSEKGFCALTHLLLWLLRNSPLDPGILINGSPRRTTEDTASLRTGNLPKGRTRAT